MKKKFRLTWIAAVAVALVAIEAHAACTTSEAKGSCGPYDNYPGINATTSSTYIGNNVWNPINGWHQTLIATDPGNWSVTANMPNGNTAVVSYASVGTNYGKVTSEGTGLSTLTSMISTFSENMNPNSQTSAWAMWDIWMKAGAEIMIQHDFARNGACTGVATATFGGSGGVPVKSWYLCTFGTNCMAWKLHEADMVQSGSVDLLAMLNWLVDHGYLPNPSLLMMIGYGWEICSTGGVDETFNVTGYSVILQGQGIAAINSRVPANSIVQNAVSDAKWTIYDVRGRQIAPNLLKTFEVPQVYFYRNESKTIMAVTR